MRVVDGPFRVDDQTTDRECHPWNVRRKIEEFGVLTVGHRNQLRLQCIVAEPKRMANVGGYARGVMRDVEHHVRGRHVPSIAVARRDDCLRITNHGTRPQPFIHASSDARRDST